ncbi:peptidase family C54-domain-containing protein [Abortiporus biennis]|nr:peptidase family C54-domain-containing protein [Abortiporus biennis]
MSKVERGSPSPSSPSGSKLPKFLQKQSRDRSRSMVDSPSGSSSTIASTSSSTSHPESPKSPPNHRPLTRKSSKKLFGHKDKEEKRRQSQDVVDNTIREHSFSHHNIDHDEHNAGGDAQDETPVIVEPVNIPRPRTRSERPLSDNYPAAAVNFYPSSSNSRITDFPSRLSGWFSHTFSSSTTDLALPSLLSQQHLAASTSPKGKGSALLTAAKHGKGHLDKAMRYLLDSDATPDNCADSIWLLGVEHPGNEPQSPTLPQTPNRRTSVDSRRSPSSHRSSPSSPPRYPDADPSLSQSQPPSSIAKDPGRHWPPVFYADFTSRIWLTYRSQFQPIRDISLDELNMDIAESMLIATSPQPKKWNWPLGGDKCWSSDAGWGCMLRTGQSLLANALLHLHLGRDWRRPPYPIHTADYATYVQILTWFLDDPSPLCPFSVHRMALVGKQLGTKVGTWFGPSTAAGAIKTLVHAFPEAGLGVAVATDNGPIYESEVLAASYTGFGSPRRSSRRVWGDRAVLILINVRLGLHNGVQPVYYDMLRNIYTWPQSVGISGGRPSSSYYFVGSQADNLFYLDPHHARPAVPLRPPPNGNEPSQPQYQPQSQFSSRQTSPEPNSSSDREQSRAPRAPHRHVRSPTSPPRSSTGSGGSSFSHRAPVSPSPLQQQLSSSSASSGTNSSQSHSRWQSASALPNDSMDSSEFGIRGNLADLDPMQRHYATAYSAAELRTFHCDRVRKMPLSGLDPSMLVGFLCKDENDWIDFKRRVADLNTKCKTVLTLQDEPPNWPSDSEMGLESISEPDFDMPEDDEDDDDGSSSDMRHSPSAGASSPDTSVSVQGGTGNSISSKSEADTEEDDPIDPITPGPGKSSFDVINVEETPNKGLRISISQSVDDTFDFDEEDDDDEEWVDSSEFTPQTPSWGIPTAIPPSTLSQPETPTPHLSAPPLEVSYSSGSAKSKESTSSKSKKRKTKKSTSSSQTISRSASSSQQQAEQYPFPATYPADEEAKEVGKRVPQMRTAKARDGGRTQSGGVRGVPTEEFEEL